MSAIEDIQQISLFKGLDDIRIQAISEIAVKKTYTKGQVIFEADMPANGFYAVLNGQVKIYRTSPSGKEQIVHIFSSGESFAEVPVFEGSTFPVSAQPLKKSVLIFIPRQSFSRIIGKDPDLAMSMMAQLSSRLRTLVDKIEDLSLRETPSRVAAYLLLKGDEQENKPFRLEMPKGQIAFYLGTIQETLSRILKKFSEDGLIYMTGKEISILDQSALREIAEQGR